MRRNVTTEAEVRERRWAAPVTVAVLLLLVASTVAGVLMIRNQATERLSTLARDAAATVRHEIQLNVGRDVAVAAALGRSLPDVRDVDDATWEATVAPLADAGAFTDTAAVNLLLVADPDTIDDRLGQLPTDVIDQLDVRLADGPSHAVVTQVWPREANAAVLGYDVFDNDGAAPAAQEAIDGPVTRGSRPITLAQEPTDQRAAVLYVPVSGPDGAVTGLVNLVFRADLVIDDVVERLPDGAHIRWLDAAADLDPDARVLADVGTPANGGVRAVDEVSEAGRTWRVEVTVPRSVLGPAEREATLLVVALGTVLASGMLVATAAWRNAARRADALVARRTADLEAATAELEARNAELRELDHLKDRLLGAVSHDLRAPLSVIHGAAELLLEREVPAAQRRQLLSRLLRQAARLRGLIDELLVADQVRAGHVHADRRPVDVRQLAAVTVADLGIGELHHVEDAPHALADAMHVERILHNLLTNALAHGAPPVEVRIVHVADDDVVEILVTDGGAGVPPHLRSQVFDPYTRRLGDEPSYGLGLAVARQLAEASGGSLTYRYRDDASGACFVLRLPVSTHPDRTDVTNGTAVDRPTVHREAPVGAGERAVQSTSKEDG